jgi:hypothetical protein
MKNVLLVILALNLASCVSYNDFTQDMIKAEILHCKEKSLKIGTEEFQKCRQEFVVGYYNNQLNDLIETDKARSSLENSSEFFDNSSASKLIRQKKLLR